MDFPGKGRLLDPTLTSTGQPTASEQLAFLDHIQRLFVEGEFSATYKFVLLLSITELAIEQGDDSGSALELSLIDIADKFLELYWPQAIPFAGGSTSGVLVQNKGEQAAVITLLEEIRRQFPTLPKARASALWPSVVQQTVTLLTKMPLWKLQVLRRQPVSFLYEGVDARTIRIFPGVTYNLRRFQGLIQQLCRTAWIGHIQANPRNEAIIGQANDLEKLLFGADRASLAQAGKVLRDLQADTCFYCKGALRGKGEVDHFIPWSRYPRDLGHNFVLAHRGCNGDKSDLLAATLHLAGWRERNAKHSGVIEQELGAYFPCSDPSLFHRLAVLAGATEACAACRRLSDHPSRLVQLC
jgi:hypothetical protein